MAAQRQAGEGQYLTFRLADEIYAMEITKVREVLDYTRITKVPKVPEFMRGIINLRGGVVPVVDLKRKFDMGETKRAVDTCIIIVEVEMENETAMIGTLADSVREVVELSAAQIEPPPRIGSQIRSDFIKGMGKQDENFIIILDINSIFSADELSLVQSVSGSETKKGESSAATAP